MIFNHLRLLVSNCASHGGENRKSPKEHFAIVEKLFFLKSECNFTSNQNPAISSNCRSGICNFKKRNPTDCRPAAENELRS
jgi:hypothetical protein